MKPDYLKENPKIYLIAPSFGCTTEPYHTRLLNAVGNLTKLGYDLYFGKNVFLNRGVAGSNSAKQRALEFMEAWKSDCDAIFSVGGGETMIELLEYINFKKLTEYKPKWFIGYSDNTNLTYTITVNTDIETIYGVNAPSLETLDYDSKDTLDIIHGKKHFKSYGKWQYEEIKNKKGYNLDRTSEIIAYNYEKPFEGILLGGCLDCLMTICGTKVDKTLDYIKRHKEDRIIFYLEACDLTSIGIRRALTNLKLAGWFKNVSGFIIGRSRLYDDTSFDTTPVESYYEILKSFNVPILLNCDLGHLGPSLPIRNGAKAKITLDKLITIDYL